VRGRIIEIGAVILKGKEIVNTYQALCNPGRRVPAKVTEITGITTKMVKDLPPPEEFMPDLHKFMGDRPIIAHNAAFDIGFLIAEMGRVGITMSNLQYICTLQLARKLIKDPLLGSYKLMDLREHTEFVAPPDHEAHRALADVHATVHLWHHLTDLIVKSDIYSESDGDSDTRQPSFAFYQKVQNMSSYEMNTASTSTPTAYNRRGQRSLGVTTTNNNTTTTTTNTTGGSGRASSVVGAMRSHKFVVTGGNSYSS